MEVAMRRVGMLCAVLVLGLCGQANAATNNSHLLDQSFGTFIKGLTYVTFPFPGNGNAEGDAVIMDGTKMVAVGGNPTFGNTHTWNVARLNANGDLDLSFGDQGRTVVAVPDAFSADCGFTPARAISKQADGKYLIAGGMNCGGVEHIAVARLNANGSLDTAF